MRRIATLLGWISLFATLALLSPGIVATARADAAAAPSGPSCPVSRDADEHTAAGLERMIEQLRADAAERGDPSGGVVSLNTRGYNYTNTAARAQTPPQAEPNR